MTTSEEVEKHFHGVEKLNCAQAVLKIMEGKFPEKAQLIPAFKAFGGGRAPEGICGALHGALELTPESEHLKIRNKFCEAAGSEKCKAIKEINKLSCPSCVEAAVDLVRNA